MTPSFTTIQVIKLQQTDVAVKATLGNSRNILFQVVGPAVTASTAHIVTRCSLLKLRCLHFPYEYDYLLLI